MAEVIRGDMTCREIQRWKAERYGLHQPRSRRTTIPLSSHSPAVQARALANDFRRLCQRYAITAEVFERVLRAVEAGTAPAPEELTQIRAAADATHAVLEQFGRLYTLAERITAACDVSPTASATGS